LGRHQLEISADTLPTENEAPWEVPRHYASHTTSGLNIEIVGPTDDLVIHLTSAAEDDTQARLKPEEP
jgi:hypothetical protein